ncbi:AraC family transcriptional regulator [Tenacibaculum sp. SZ-18]|uniref:AraC family transcriptional regulator n=1 Tax=Tenacibaculum sp. SZ-18 TaxID=754423 RepID=UPI0018E28E16|nr:AraC family transcriptional regulator ligand-binding domain-containing protein [Tenacibaculum sp. SZ-18]
MNSLEEDMSVLLKKYKITREQLRNTESFIPLSSVTNILEECAIQTNCYSFGLELSKYQSIDVLGPIAMVIRNAKTMGDAITLAAKYLHIHSTGIILKVYEQSSLISGAIELSLEVNSGTGSSSKQCLELCVADLHKILKLIIGDSYIPLKVAFSHERLSNSYSKFFNSSFIFNHFRSGIHVNRELLEVSIKNRSDIYLKTAEEYLKNNYELRNEEVDLKVKRMLFRFLGTEYASKRNICKALAYHPRTLQRQLVKRGTSFEKLKEDVRKEVLYTYLTKTTMSYFKLTDILGYSEISSLSRACKEWYGKTMTEIRTKN